MELQVVPESVDELGVQRITVGSGPRRARAVARLLLLLGWFTSTAMAACLPVLGATPAGESDKPSIIHPPEIAGHGHHDTSCDPTHAHLPYPVLAKGGASAEPALSSPAQVASGKAPVRSAESSPTLFRTDLSLPPIYLLYSRLLIPAFS